MFLLDLKTFPKLNNVSEFCILIVGSGSSSSGMFTSGLVVSEAETTLSISSDVAKSS